LESEGKAAVIQPIMPIESVVEGVSHYYKTNSDNLRAVVRGPTKGNEARKIAMYLCQEISAAKLVDIAAYFGLGNIGSVSFITHQIRKRKREDDSFKSEIDSVILYVVREVTCLPRPHLLDLNNEDRILDDLSPRELASEMKKQF
ncbi:MAG: hypothetical protein KUG82_14025, partial [Pseudomonadales bacterium]|nr:hypothetical protein [Pseudomonadales bacterium]